MFRDTLDDINYKIEDLAGDEGLIFVDVYKELKDYSGNRLLLFVDQVHTSELGQSLIFNAVLDALYDALEE